ncbi:hypothetical protein [Rathayibacter sp. SD072]|uniref:hypothetical protein n=1 Tax=Rathayibacter sp. SD072 TaxID=2781731 RepID=UPI001A975392|nr:hypothetical protein [Rathayibacter sp. SD072]MBO0983537.1 hypothetical protein [Rathayibacter sp. SD072]
MTVLISTATGVLTPPTSPSASLTAVVSAPRHPVKKNDDDLLEEAARHTRFWASYDADPRSATAWADAATSTWRRPEQALTTAVREGLDQWDEEGGYDPA